MRVIVRLTPEEQEAIREHSKKVTQHHKDKGDTDRFVCGDIYDPDESQCIGFASEFAVAKHLGIPYEFKLIQGGDLYDLDYRNAKLEIKFVYFKERNPELRVAEDKMWKPFTHLVLVKRLWEIESFEILGWTPRELFVKDPMEVDGIRKPQQRLKSMMYCMPWGELQRPEFLINIGEMQW